MQTIHRKKERKKITKNGPQKSNVFHSSKKENLSTQQFIIKKQTNNQEKLKA